MGCLDSEAQDTKKKVSMDQFLSGTNDSYMTRKYDKMTHMYIYISVETKKIGKKESNINSYINENNYRQSLQYLFLHLTCVG